MTTEPVSEFHTLSKTARSKRAEENIMAARKTAQKDPVDVLFGDADTISPQQLADHLGVDPKSVRAKLRSQKFRDQSQEKNNRWNLTKDQVRAFTTKPEKAEPTTK